MKITAVETATLAGPGDPSWLLVLRTDTASVGVGELIVEHPSLLDAPWSGLSELLVGRDPYDTQAFVSDAHDRVAPALLAGGLIAAAETAMSDLVARDLGVPIHQLMGGRVRDHIRACAVGWMGVDGVGDPADAARRAVASGYTALRVEPRLSPSMSRDECLTTVIELVRSVREAVPDAVDIVVDVARGFDDDTAVELAGALRRFEPLWLEDPIGSDEPAALLDLVRRLRLPLASGRRSTPERLLAMAAGGLVDHLIVDVARVGGLLEARQLAAIAEISHVDVVAVHAGGAVALATTLQLAAAIPNLAMVETRPGAVAVEDGMIAVDIGPGLGLGPMLIHGSEART